MGRRAKGVFRLRPIRASYSQRLKGAGFHFVQVIVDRLLGRPLKRVFQFLCCDFIHHLAVRLLLTYVLPYRGRFTRFYISILLHKYRYFLISACFPHKQPLYNFMQFHTAPRRNGVKMVYGKSDCRRENDTLLPPQKSNESSDEAHSHRHDRPTDMPMVVSFSAAFRGEY